MKNSRLVLRVVADNPAGNSCPSSMQAAMYRSAAG